MKYTCEINKDLQTELNKSFKRNCIIAVVAGIIGLLAYIVIPKEMLLMEILLWISSCAFGIGLVLLISINTVNKKASDNKIVGEYELEETFMIINAFKNGEQISSAKVYYKDLIKTKETENYLFLYPNKQTAYPVPKNKLTPEELSLVKVWIQASKNQNLKG